MLLEYQNICITDSSGADHHHIRHSAHDPQKAYNNTTTQGMQPWHDRKSWPQLLTECCKCRKCCEHFEHNLNTEMCHIDRDVKYAQYLGALNIKFGRKQTSSGCCHHENVSTIPDRVATWYSVPTLGMKSKIMAELGRMTSGLERGPNTPPGSSDFDTDSLSICTVLHSLRHSDGNISNSWWKTN